MSAVNDNLPRQGLHAHSITYRPEVDGLRAIAVLSVVLFHAFPGLLPGGFIGVDIFFVISGYLITSILLKEMADQRFSFARFYERRARRLLPPLLPVLAVTTVLCIFLLNTVQYADYLKSLKANALFVSNWHFLKSISYFDTPGATTPLLHTWSLSIEEQFYFIFPALLLALTTLCRKAVLPAIVILLLASFAYAEFLLANNKLDTAFYNSAARFWELLVGGLLGAVPQVSLSRRLASLIEAMGIGLLAFALLTFDQQTRFPGASALLPTFGAAALIATGGKGRIATILASRPMTSVGLVSYALYLWHWPLMVAAHLVTPTPPIWLMTLAVLGSLLLAWLSYIFIERPVRTRKLMVNRKSVWALASVTVIGVALSSLLLKTPTLKQQQSLAHGAVARMMYSEEKNALLDTIATASQAAQERFNLNFTGKSGDFERAKLDKWTCSFDYDNSLSRLEACVTQQATDNDVLVMGDSIGRDTTHALRLAFPQQNFIMLHQSSCPPGETNTCFRGQKQLLESLSSKLALKAIVIAFRYQPTHYADVEPGLRAARKITSNVYMLGISPMFALPMADFVRSLPLQAMPENGVLESNETMVPWNYEALRDKARNLAQRGGATFVDVLPFFCDGKQCRIWAGDQYGKPLFFDQQHLTADGIESFGSFLKQRPELRSFL